MPDREPHTHAKEHEGPDFVIVGPLRAGTTMFRLMLGSHPDIVDIGEFEESVAMLGDDGYPAPKDYVDWLAVHRVAQSREYQLPDKPSSYHEIVRAMWAKNAATAPAGSVIGCTIHSRIDRILDLWPNTKLICLVRDPRDVCQSCVGMGWYGHAALAYPKWLEPIQRWESAKSRISDDRWTMVRYEDLLRSPESELSKCTDLLGLEYSPLMLSFHESSSYQKLDPKLAEQWKEKMPPRCADLIEWHCTPTMNAYGYKQSTTQPRPPSVFESFSIRLKNKLGRVRGRINRYGPCLVAVWSVAKHFPPSSKVHAYTKSRINMIDTLHLK